MLFYKIEDMKLFIESECKGVVSFIIGPIMKKYYELICYVKNEEFRLLYAENDIKNLVEFLKLYSPKPIPFSEFCEKTSKEKEFIEAYKNKFMKDIDISFLKEQILSVGSFRSNGKKIENAKGLDGFWMDCNVFNTNEVFEMRCVAYSKEYQEIIDLANSLLDYLGVVKTCRFIIIDKR